MINLFKKMVILYSMHTFSHQKMYIRMLHLYILLFLWYGIFFKN